MTKPVSWRIPVCSTWCKSGCLCGWNCIRTRSIFPLVCRFSVYSTRLSRAVMGWATTSGVSVCITSTPHSLIYFHQEVWILVYPIISWRHATSVKMEHFLVWLTASSILISKLLETNPLISMKFWQTMKPAIQYFHNWKEVFLSVGLLPTCYIANIPTETSNHQHAVAVRVIFFMSSNTVAYLPSSAAVFATATATLAATFIAMAYAIVCHFCSSSSPFHCHLMTYL